MQRWLLSLLLSVAVLCCGSATAGFFGPSSFNGGFFQNPSTFDPATTDLVDVSFVSDLGLTKTGSDIDEWAAQVQSNGEYMEDAAGNKPSVDAVTTLNGHETIRFDQAANESMTFRESGGGNWTKSAGSHYFLMVVKFISPTGTEYAIDFATGRFTLFPSVASDGNLNMNYNTGVVDSGDSTTSNWIIWEAELDATGYPDRS